MLHIDWESNQSALYANPCIDPLFYPSHAEEFQQLPAHIWVATSGTTQSSGNSIKWVALSKKAFLASAEAVNGYLEASHSDIWLNALPLFHVGGLSIYARAFLSGAKVETASFTKWNPKKFIEALQSTEATLTALVPAQLHDLVREEFSAPKDLRALIIGGGHLSSELYEQAKSLKWPVIPTFGMTECASQVAAGTWTDSRLRLLPHIQGSLSSDGCLQIASPALFTVYLRWTSGKFTWEDPKKAGVFTTEDKVVLNQGILSFLGRASDWIKIGGENVSLAALGYYFDKIRPLEMDAFIHAVSDERLAHVIELVALHKDASQINSLIEAFNAGVMPYEKIRKFRLVNSIPRSALGKILKTNIID